MATATMNTVFSQKDLLSYLSLLPPNVLSALYTGEGSEHACQAVFRALSAQARVYILRAIAGQSCAEDSFSWRTSLSVHDSALASLLKLNIFELSIEKTRKSQGPTSYYRISQAFAKNIRLALISTATLSKVPVIPKFDRDRAEEFAKEQWNGILGFLVSSTGGVLVDEDAPKRATARSQKRQRLSTTGDYQIESVVQRVLLEMGLVTIDGNGNRQITSNGYEFMLKDVFDQVWTVLQNFVANLDSDMQSRVLALLFRMSFMKTGQVVDVASFRLSSNALSFFEACGLVTEASNGKALVSTLGVHAIVPPSNSQVISVGNAQAQSRQDITSTTQQLGLGGMKIIVETTFKVYCYTTSQMHAQMLQLFCEIEAKLPNMVVAMITRESISEAFKKGISDEQLISFLQQNAHPVTQASRRHVVPDNVSDQIRLWKRETERIKTVTGRMVYMDTEPHVYDEVLRLLDPACVAWKDASSVRVFIPGESFDKFKEALQTARTKLKQAAM